MTDGAANTGANADIPLVGRDSEAAGSGDVMADRVAALRRLFPEADADGAINVDVLRQLLGEAVEEGEERYGLHWRGKARARALALTPSTGTLRPAPAESPDWDTTQNIMIEGDNLEVLKLIRRAYAGKVKLIYIDPPYNTGKDFVYPDDYRDPLSAYLELTGQTDAEGRRMTSNKEASGRYHTAWLNMMYPRLMLAKELLREDGIFLYSIDDAELANSRETLNEIFGPSNFIGSITWDKSRKNDAKLLSAGHDYILIYAKSATHLRESGVVWREPKPGTREVWSEYLKLREQHGANNVLIEQDLQRWFKDLPKTEPAKKWSRYKRVDKYGPWRDRDISWPGGGGPRYDVLHPVTGQPCKVPERGWIYASIEEMNRQIKLGTVSFRETHEDPPFRKFHLKPLSDELAGDDDGDVEDSEDDELATQVRTSYLYKQSQVSVKELRALMGAKVFTNPKDHIELARLFEYVTEGDSDAIIMDFFAGSGSSGHAVMEQNAADGGERRFMLVQLPEPLDPSKKPQKASADFCDKLGKPRTIAELTKERLRRAGDKVRRDNPETTVDTGFRVFKLDTSNLKPWNPQTDDLQGALLDAVDNVLTGRSEEDLLTELLLKTGVDLSMPSERREIAGKTVHALGGGVLMVCLSAIGRDDAEALGQGMCDWRDALAPVRPTTFWFRDSGFADAATRANLAAIIRQRLGTQVEKLGAI